MRRGAVVAFGALVAATIAAFVVTQHLKVSTPLIAGFPSPSPAVINPNGGACNGVDHRRMRISFYLLHRADDVDAYVVDESGTIVRTLATGRHMRRAVRHPDGDFSWNGREDNGSIAPDGRYYIRVALLGQGRTIQLAKPITVKRVPPHPSVRGVSPSLIPRGGRTAVTISYRGNQNLDPVVLIYRTDVPGRPFLVDRFQASHTAPAEWNGQIQGHPAPAGTYLVGLEVTDAACNVGRFPVTLPPPPGTTRGAGVSVRYLAAQPSLDPVPAGSRAVIDVDARGRGFQWTLWRAGVRKPITGGSERAGEYVVRVRLPRTGGAGLYKLSVRAGSDHTEVPVVARAATGHAKILVVLPALTWQGHNPIDDPPRDGIPNTLDNGGPIDLERPLARGLPPGYVDEEAFLAYLDKAHLPYDLTTDIALIDGASSTLSGHAGVVLAGAERWLPALITDGLRTYVENGGHVLSLGIDSLRRNVTVHLGALPVALDPTAPSSKDAFGARPGALVTGNTDLITVLRDGLGIFTNTSGAFSGYRSLEPITPPPSNTLSEAATSTAGPSIVGYQLGKGVVVDIGLVSFGSSLASNVDAKELISRVWTVLSR